MNAWLRYSILIGVAAIAVVIVLLLWGTQSRLTGTVVFASAKSGNSELYRLSARGIENLTKNPAFDGQPRISPDRTKVLFTTNRDGNDEIYVLDLATRTVSNLTNDISGDRLASWSSDGAKILFMSDRGGKRRFEPWLMDVDGENPQRFTPFETYDLVQFSRLNNGGITAKRNNEGTHVVATLEASTGRLRRYEVTPTGQFESCQALPKPSSLHSLEVDGVRQYFLFDLATETSCQLTFQRTSVAALALSPDDSKTLLLVTSKPDGGSRLIAQSLPNNTTRVVSEVSGRVESIDWR